MRGRRLDVAHHDRARRRPASSPASGCSTPPTIFISVDLPAPFSPSSATTSPACTLEAHAAQRVHAGKALLDVPQLEDRHAHAGERGASATAQLRRASP